MFSKLVKRQMKACGYVTKFVLEDSSNLWHNFTSGGQTCNRL